MSQTPPPQNNPRKPTYPAFKAPPSRPGQDIIALKKEAKQFPAIGMTLNSYQSSTNPVQPAVALKKPKAAKKSRFSRFRRKFTIKRVIVTLLIAILCVGGFLGSKFMYDLHKVFGGSILDLLHTTKLNGEDQGRVTILLAGNSADDPGHDGANLTDSIMLISIDTKNNTAWLLSIPRDLWVNVDDQGYQKINQAYVDGQADNFSADGFPDGGMGQLEQVVSQDFDIPINYYALVDYSALKEAVSAVGGINVDIQSSDPRGLYDPSIDYATHGPLVKLSNGEHTLDGEQALDLARARGDAYGSYGFPMSDFNRTQNQRLMLVALKQKISASSTLANPVALSSLLSAFGNNVKTDLSLSDAKRLYQITKPIPSSSIASLSLNSANGQNLLASYTASNGEESLIPVAGIGNYNDIQSFVAQHTSTNPVVQEDASVVVLNGTDTFGLASTFKTKLTSNHFDVSSIADASTSDQTSTQIINASNGKKPATLAALTKLIGNNNVTTVNPYSAVYPKADFILVLGNDEAATPSTP